MKAKLWLAISFILLTALSQAQAVKVETRQNADGTWELLRNGEPYYIKGAGGHTQLDKLVQIGGNSFRTWSTDDALAILDEAQKRGLTVMMGLWVQHERHGFDYDNKERVAKQLENFRNTVIKIKDHPALLLWGVGNEVDLQYTNTNVWYAVNDIAAMIHEVDPNHPTCTVTAGLDSLEVALIKERAPEIDIYGINTYGDLGKVKDNIRRFGWDGPYIISEWGPNGHWEVAKTAWGAPVEQSSTEKADSYKTRYTEFIAGDKAHCLGSYVFLWGFKQETTSTWYGMFLDGGEASQAVEVLDEAWNGKTPANRAPRVKELKLNGLSKGDDIYLTSQDKYTVVANFEDPDGDKIKYRYEIVPESTNTKSGGDAEERPDGIKGLFSRSSGPEATFRAPKSEGPYRLFVFAFDRNGYVGYANIPFYVTPRPYNSEQARFIELKPTNMDSFENIHNP